VYIIAGKNLLVNKFLKNLTIQNTASIAMLNSLVSCSCRLAAATTVGLIRKVVVPRAAAIHTALALDAQQFTTHFQLLISCLGSDAR
jgi:hypothetical protein